MEYIEKPATGGEGNFFVDLPAQTNDRENLILYRGEHAFIILNAYPYSNGHLMIVPYRHTASLQDIENQTSLEVMQLLQFGTQLLSAAFHPDGFNLGMNMGRVAGAGIADHLHWHIVPRWNGDTNFMPVLADVRVIPESLQVVYDRLLTSMQKLGSTGAK